MLDSVKFYTDNLLYGEKSFLIEIYFPFWSKEDINYYSNDRLLVQHQRRMFLY